MSNPNTPSPARPARHGGAGEAAGTSPRSADSLFRSLFLTLWIARETRIERERESERVRGEVVTRDKDLRERERDKERGVRERKRNE